MLRGVYDEERCVLIKIEIQIYILKREREREEGRRKRGRFGSDERLQGLEN